jgi:hypothetical protein
MAPSKLFHDADTHLPQEFLEQYDLLRQWYGLPDIPLKVGLSYHGAHTDMSSIEIGIQLVAACLKENYHGFQGSDLDKIAGAATYFIIAHEIAHNTTHPGRQVGTWENSVKGIDVEKQDKLRWMNIISDIAINYNIINGMNLVQGMSKKDRKTIADQMRLGLMTEIFLRRSPVLSSAAVMVNSGKNAYGEPVIDNRLMDDAGVPVTLDENTPLWQQFQGYGRGEQLYPSIAYCTLHKMDERWRKVRCLKGSKAGGVSLNNTYTVTNVRTFDGRTPTHKNFTPWEPIKDYEINGTWQSSRYFLSLCPDTGEIAPTIWEGNGMADGSMARYFWAFVSKSDSRAVKEKGYEYLGTQLFCYEWAGIYATGYPKYAGKSGVNAAEQWIDDIVDDMNKVMIYA